MKPIYFPDNISWLVCSDFDETFFAHDLANANDVAALDDYIARRAEQGLLFGIVSASTIDMIKECMKRGHFSYYPHFISSNSGTELRYYKDGKEIYDTDYEAALLHQGFTKTTIMEVEAQLSSEGIPLEVQTAFMHAPFSRNYYYKKTTPETDASHFARIRQLAAAHQLTVNINQCNPLIGDPAGHYDIDFFPAGAGKDAVVNYLIKKFSVPVNQTIAFGDSGNDINMLNAVEYGYLVSNATAEAKQLYPSIAEHPYNKGILTTLTHIVKE